ncbi:type II secretion system F family protein [Streptomyces sp. HMX87]|uniref:type II secretion system F family protein n=1 Tax=Streptomyces sp. HMX87 TaxID=3390849 RepID=UPI003A86AADF
MNGELVHRLGTAAGVALGVALAAGWLARLLGDARRGRRARRRLAVLLGPARARAAPGVDVRGAVRGWLPLLGTACAGWALVGGFAGVLVGAAVAAGLRWWRLRQAAGGATAATAASGAEVEAAARELPLAADLLAACIAAGAAPVAAARAVGDALGGPVGKALARGSAEVRLGGEPGAAWHALAVLPGAGGLARLLERADVSGLPAAGPVARLAAQARADWARATTARARRAAVMVTAPVGLCFLPAFIAVGVLPVVIGLADGVPGGMSGGGGR